MGSGRKGNPRSKPHDATRAGNAAHTRASLPPKPACQKRSRNTETFLAVPFTTPNDTVRTRAQRPWGRRSASWSPEEDAQLVELVNKESTTPPSITASKTWSRVAAQLTNRTGKQCRERFLNQLKPGIRRDPWTSEEERILREAHRRFGNKWVTIAAELPGRTDNCVKNHWNSMLRKRQRREVALKAAQAEVAANLGGRTGLQVEREGLSEADYSARTGHVTPSGGSPSHHDFTTSGMPSPYAASSPLTPRRDSKLQISTLVAGPSTDLPTWNVPYAEIGGFGGGRASAQCPVEPLNLGAFNTGVRAACPVKCSTPVTTLATMQSSPHLHLQDRFGEFAVRSSGAEGSLFKDASAMNCIASASAVPQLIHGAHSKAREGGPHESRELRRSNRLLSSSLRNSSRGALAISRSPNIIQKTDARTDGPFEERAGGNALAALAAAASSVPPSPLTPESRLSYSRSRSMSPDLHSGSRVVKKKFLSKPANRSEMRCRTPRSGETSQAFAVDTESSPCRFGSDPT